MAVGLTIVGLMVLMGCGAWFGLAWISVHPPRAPLFLGPYDTGFEWQNVSVASRDGLQLAAWWLPHPEPLGVVILCHGYLVNRCEVLGVAATLRREGFSCLLFDFRACGQSDGLICTIGAREVGDALGAVDWVERFAPGLPIALFGSSMGGAVALMTTARDTRVGAVATDCAYADLQRASNDFWRAGAGPLLGTLSQPAKWIAALMTGARLSEARPVDEIAKIAPRPVLLLHSRGDGIVPLHHGEALFAAAQQPKTFWFATDSQHVQARSDHPRAYYAQLVPFLQNWARESQEKPAN